MALFLELHRGDRLGAVQAGHQSAMEGVGTQAIRYLRYWVGGALEVFCLVEAPDREAVTAVCRRGSAVPAATIVEVPGPGSNGGGG